MQRKSAELEAAKMRRTLSSEEAWTGLKARTLPVFALSHYRHDSGPPLLSFNVGRWSVMQGETEELQRVLHARTSFLTVLREFVERAADIVQRFGSDDAPDVVPWVSDGAAPTLPGLHGRRTYKLRNMLVCTH